ncbi:MAG: hypothetical protein AAF799_26375 [Myxococcota bacterium]
MVSELMNHLKTTWPLLALLAAGCPDDSTPARSAPPSPTKSPSPADDASPGEAGTPEPAAESGEHGRLLKWMDPEAVAVAYLRTPRQLKADIVSVIYALPPRAEDLLKGVSDVEHALDAVRPSDAPEISTWLGTQALATTGRFSRRPTVLRPLVGSREEAGKQLEAMGLVRKEVDVFEVWEPQRVFPYRVVLLDNDVAAFVPASDPGTGVAPLAAARDMPPGDVRNQLDELLNQPGGPTIALLASGPMMHFDVDQPIIAVRFEMRKTAGGRMDGRMDLQLEEKPEEAVSALLGRSAPEQNDRIQDIMKRAAFAVEGAIVTGRLELPPADVALLYEER